MATTKITYHLSFEGENLDKIEELSQKALVLMNELRDVMSQISQLELSLSYDVKSNIEEKYLK